MTETVFDVFGQQVITEQFDQLTLKFDDELHKYSYSPVRLPLQNTGEIVPLIELDHEILLEVYGMTVPQRFYVYEIERDMKARQKTLHLAPMTRKMQRFECGEVDYATYQDNDYHIDFDITDPKYASIADKQEALLLDALFQAFRRSDESGGERVFTLLKDQGLSFSRDAIDFDSSILTSAVDFDRSSTSYLPEDTVTHTVFSLEGQLSANDIDGVSQALPLGLYRFVTEIDFDLTGGRQLPESGILYHHTHEGDIERMGRFAPTVEKNTVVPATLDGYDLLTWRTPNEVDWIRDQAWVNYWDDYQDSEVYQQTISKLTWFNYDDGVGPWWGILHVNTLLDTATGPDPAIKWEVQSIYSPSFLNHQLQVGWTNPKASDVWNDVAKLVGGYWYVQDRTPQLATRDFDSTNTFTVTSQDIESWRQRDFTVDTPDLYPSDSVKINTTIRTNIQNRAERIYGGTLREHTIVLGPKDRDAVPSLGEFLVQSSVSGGTTRIGLIRQIDFHQDRRMTVHCLGEAV